MNLEKVENIKRPLKKGEKFLVPCIVRREQNLEDWKLENGELSPRYKERIYITPIINHVHNDKENGQLENHYHVDYRFIKHKGDGNFPEAINKHSKYRFVEKVRPIDEAESKIEYFVMPVINEDFAGITPVNFIQKSKLKHKCIHKGKCPHRGYDLYQVPSVNGKITCPLHGLEFDEKSGSVLNFK